MRFGENTAFASIKLMPVSDYKLLPLARFIKGKKVNEASSQLDFLNKKFAKNLRDLLLSCIANAKHNHGLDVEKLIVDRVLIGRAMILRRFMARGRGRSTRINKRYSRVTIVVRQLDSEIASNQKQKK